MTSEGVVYVVDDDASLRRALARTIAATGLDVETFASTRAFLAQPLADRPACLVLDLRLPGESGLDLQAALGEGQRRLPIIFLTGHATVPATVRAMKEGALDFLQKPVPTRGPWWMRSGGRWPRAARPESSRRHGWKSSAGSTR